jgi:hypothetical protein
VEPFLAELSGQRVFIAMQWFSREARARFDNVFTDGMTFTDHRGRAGGCGSTTRWR